MAIHINPGGFEMELRLHNYVSRNVRRPRWRILVAKWYVDRNPPLSLILTSMRRRGQDPDVADHIVSYQLELMNAMHALSLKIGESHKGVAEKTVTGRKGLKRGREARTGGTTVGHSPFR
jgi:hypothetical protein